MQWFPSGAAARERPARRWRADPRDTGLLLGNRFKTGRVFASAFFPNPKGIVIVGTDHVASLRRKTSLPAGNLTRLGVVLTVVLAVLVGSAAIDVAPALSHHMSLHILLMNVLAPLIALALTTDRRFLIAFGAPSVLLAATIAQLAALWAAHVPVVMAAAMQAPLVQIAVQAVLLGTALLFWLSVFAQRGAARWRALVALLLTGKLFCLLAALLVFAPRHLYPAMAHGGHGAETAPQLADQQLAGLLMIAACPTTYVAAAVVIAARWLKEIGRDAAPAAAAERGS